MDEYETCVINSCNSQDERVETNEMKVLFMMKLLGFKFAVYPVLITFKRTVIKIHEADDDELMPSTVKKRHITSQAIGRQIGNVTFSTVDSISPQGSVNPKHQSSISTDEPRSS
ncbi:hypothetical protein BGZ47_010970 [Haplosporangium gracile]|nr:hypothetical protein BGZ47_010970 [Haplosporangium gracile]